MKALGCPFCKYIWLPKYPGRVPKSCPRCHRYFTEKRPVQWVEVPDDYFEKPVQVPKIKPVVLPKSAFFTCQRCGQKVRRGGIVEGEFLCINCIVDKLMEKKPREMSYKELIKHELAKHKRSDDVEKM